MGKKLNKRHKVRKHKGHVPKKTNEKRTNFKRQIYQKTSKIYENPPEIVKNQRNVQTGAQKASRRAPGAQKVDF